MGKYGISAIKAVDLITKGYTKNPKKAWEKATIEVFRNGTSGQKKGCPKETFLSLCCFGFIKDVPSGSYTDSIKNKEYAIEAVKILKINPQMPFPKKSELWNMVAGKKTYNQQMDVVISLWNKGFIL